MKLTRVEIVCSSKYQAHLNYNLVGRHQLSNIKSSIVSDVLLVEEWLKIVKDVYENLDHDRCK